VLTELRRSATPRSAVAVIPARDGSKGLPGKNVRLIAGVPLYRWTVDQARAAGLSQMVITTDIPAIIDADPEPDLVVHRRPPELCGDEVPMSPVLVDVLARAEFDDDPIVVLLQVTTPLRLPEQIVAAVDVFRSSGVELVMSVCEADRGVLKYGTLDGDTFVPMRSARDTFSNRQQLPDVYRPNGAIYVFGAQWYRTNQELATASVAAYVMPEEDSIDIDGIDDFEQCARIIERRGHEQRERVVR
jgi:CMP-N,N'-diacetyllegionaminic acid synthase